MEKQDIENLVGKRVHVKGNESNTVGILRVDTEGCYEIRIDCQNGDYARIHITDYAYANVFVDNAVDENGLPFIEFWW